MNEFDSGDLVYCPSATTELCILCRTGESHFAVKGLHSDTLFNCVESDGTPFEGVDLPYIVLATDGNRKALNEAYGLEFEANNELHRSLDFAKIVCYVSDVNTNPNEFDSLAIVIKYNKEGYHTQNGFVWRYATAIANSQARL